MDNTNPTPLPSNRVNTLGLFSFLVFSLIESLLCYFFSGKYWPFYALSFTVWTGLFVFFQILGVRVLLKLVLAKTGLLSSRYSKPPNDGYFIASLSLTVPLFIYTMVNILNVLPGRFYSISNAFLVLGVSVFFGILTTVLFNRFKGAGHRAVTGNFLFYAVFFGASAVPGIFLVGSELQQEHWPIKLAAVILFCLILPLAAVLLFKVINRLRLPVKGVSAVVVIVLLLVVELHIALPIRDNLAYTAAAAQPLSKAARPPSKPLSKPLSEVQKPNILLMVMDTARAANMSLYGYERPTTPNLEALAEEAVVFDNAISTAPWTLPSHGSLFTGLYSYIHGAVHGDSKQNQGAPLAEEYDTLAEILSRNGYATGAVTANTAFLGPWTGLDQGFDYFWWGRCRDSVLFINRLAALTLDPAKQSELKTRCGITKKTTAKRINGVARNRLDQMADKEKPWFLFVNYMECHGLNYLPAPYADMYSSPPPIKHMISDSDTGYYDTTAAKLKRIHGWYDNQMASLDHEIGAFLSHLKKEDLFDDTLIVILSDHGELLGEHRFFGHGFWLYHELLHVPLVIKYPSGGASAGETTGKRVTEMVQNIDVFAEILDRSGIALPEGIQGQPLKRVVHPIMSEVFRNPQFKDRWGGTYDNDLKALYSKRRMHYKLIRTSGGDNQLFNLTEDRGEAHPVTEPEGFTIDDIADELKGFLALLDQTKAAIKKKIKPDKKKKMDKATRERLRSLGYIK